MSVAFNAKINLQGDVTEQKNSSDRVGSLELIAFALRLYEVRFRDESSKKGNSISSPATAHISMLGRSKSAIMSLCLGMRDST